jgi:hypothetical protein
MFVGESENLLIWIDKSERLLM